MQRNKEAHFQNSFDVAVLLERQRYRNRCSEAELNGKEMSFFDVFCLAVRNTLHEVVARVASAPSNYLPT